MLSRVVLWEWGGVTPSKRVDPLICFRTTSLLCFVRGELRVEWERWIRSEDARRINAWHDA